MPRFNRVSKWCLLSCSKWLDVIVSRPLGWINNTGFFPLLRATALFWEPLPRTGLIFAVASRVMARTWSYSLSPHVIFRGGRNSLFCERGSCWWVRVVPVPRWQEWLGGTNSQLEGAVRKAWWSSRLLLGVSRVGKCLLSHTLCH